MGSNRGLAHAFLPHLSMALIVDSSEQHDCIDRFSTVLPVQLPLNCMFQQFELIRFRPHAALRVRDRHGGPLRRCNFDEDSHFSNREGAVLLPALAATPSRSIVGLIKRAQSS